MILDRLENAAVHGALGAEVAMAFEYLRRTDFSQVPNGRYELDGDRVYAMVQRYQPKPLSDATWEAHRRYLDVQYVAEGTEQIGCAPLHDGLPVRQAYDPKSDAALYNVTGEFHVLPAGSFAIFAPQDVHAPGVAIDGPNGSGQVCKVVVKCRVPER